MNSVSTILYRRSLPADARDIYLCKQDMLFDGQVNNDFTDPFAVLAIEHIFSNIMEGVSQYILAIHNQQVLGFSELVPRGTCDRTISHRYSYDTRYDYKLANLFVSSKFQNQWIGHQLLAAMILDLETEKNIYLHVLGWNNRAQKLYKSLWFEKAWMYDTREPGSPTYDVMSTTIQSLSSYLRNDY